MHCGTACYPQNLHPELSKVGRYLEIHISSSTNLLSSPTKILRSFPPLQAEIIKEVTLSLINKIPDDVYAEIVSQAK